MRRERGWLKKTTGGIFIEKKEKQKKNTAHKGMWMSANVFRWACICKKPQGHSPDSSLDNLLSCTQNKSSDDAFDE